LDDLQYVEVAPKKQDQNPLQGLSSMSFNELAATLNAYYLAAPPPPTVLFCMLAAQRGQKKATSLPAPAPGPEPGRKKIGLMNG
jgi:hypothetical protein